MKRYIVEKELLGENIETVKALADGAIVYGVLKADGYGLGLEPMARALSEHGIDRFCVTEPDDVPRLMGLDLPVREILMLRPVHEEDELALLMGYPAVTFSVGSAEDAALLNALGRRFRVKLRAHIEIDTGLGRYGVSWKDPAAAERLCAGRPWIEYTGIFTHFARGYSRRTIRRQFRRFLHLTERLEAGGYSVGVRHCASSSALLLCPGTRLDAVRIGSAFLGRAIGSDRRGLRRVGCCEAQVETVRELTVGQTVGYGSTFRVRRSMRAAVVNIGSVHGLGAECASGRRTLLSRLRAAVRAVLSLLRGRTSVAGELRGHTVPVVGSVFSECAVLDVSSCACRPGDIVRFPINPMYQHNMECVWIERVS